MPAVGPAASEQSGCCLRGAHPSSTCPAACSPARLKKLPALRGCSVPLWLPRPACVHRAHPAHPRLCPATCAAVDLPRGAIIHTNKGDIWLKLFPDEASLCAPGPLGLRFCAACDLRRFLAWPARWRASAPAQCVPTSCRRGWASKLCLLRAPSHLTAHLATSLQIALALPTPGPHIPAASAPVLSR